MSVNRYHTALVLLHWLLAVLLVLALVMGSQVLAELPNTAPEKLGVQQTRPIATLARGAIRGRRCGAVSGTSLHGPMT